MHIPVVHRTSVFHFILRTAFLFMDMDYFYQKNYFSFHGKDFFYFIGRTRPTHYRETYEKREKATNCLN